MNQTILAGVIAVCLSALAGCQKSRNWEIAVENQSETPCTVVVDHGNNSYSRVDHMAKGGPTVLHANSVAASVVSVKVVREGIEQEIKSPVQLVPGKRFLVRVSPDGKATTSLSDQ